METWLLTGGAGYIGSHVLRALVTEGHQVVVLDDLSTGDPKRVPASVPLIRAGVGDADALRAGLDEHGVTGVIHLAAKKSVPDSIANPIFYYEQNVAHLAVLLETLHDQGVQRFVFSSSAAVYGSTTESAVNEDSPTKPDSPYGRSKLIGEWMVADQVRATGLRAVSLRYFNVVGCAAPELADNTGANLFPVILRGASSGQAVQVFGGSHPTPDGTCVRDYIHVADLAQAHVAACAATAASECAQVVNIGCGRGYSVLEVLSEFSAQAHTPIAYEIVDARAGDPASMVALPQRARAELGWSSRLSLRDMVASAWAGGHQG